MRKLRKPNCKKVIATEGKKDKIISKVYLLVLTLLGGFALLKGAYEENLIGVVASGFLLVYGALIEVCGLLNKRRGSGKNGVRKVLQEEEK